MGKRRRRVNRTEAHRSDREEGQKRDTLSLGEKRRFVRTPMPQVRRAARIGAYITDELSISRILDHLGLSPPEPERPPPRREVVRVPVEDEGREIQAG